MSEAAKEERRRRMALAFDAENHDLVARLREGRSEGSHLRWAVTPIHLEAAAEIERLRRFVQYVANFSNDPQVVKEAMAHGAK